MAGLEGFGDVERSDITVKSLQNGTVQPGNEASSPGNRARSDPETGS